MKDRGGRQPGPGRPSQFNSFERAWCYAECFSVRGEHQRTKELQYWELFEDLPELRKSQNALNKVPLNIRAAVATILTANSKVEKAKLNALLDAAKSGDDEADQIIEAHKLLTDTRAEVDGICKEALWLTHGRSCPSARPRHHRLPGFYAVRRNVFGEVARRASEKFGRRITATEVETNWKFMRAKLKL